MNSTFHTTLTDGAALALLGERVASTRLRQNRRQDQVADEAGVSVSTVRRLEGGASIQLDKLIRILRALDLLPNLDLLVPAAPANPVALKKLRGVRRQRATGEGAAQQGPERPWTWGDEE